MPGKVGVKIKAARNLPVMDKSSETTDAFVEIKLASVTHKTDVFRKSLNPTWNTDWFRFEVDDAELQDEPLQIRLMDYDTYSANDAIGKVNISLNPLCLESSSQAVHGKGTVLSGWIPVFDTMHGIRGEINVIVKVDLFSDVNKFPQCVPFGYRAQVIHGFVEELVVNDDPEYQWIDKIRTPRASNEARQVVFLKLSGQVQRRMGLKAINMGANAVIGYTQCFDLEGDVGVVARGIGTAVTLIKDTSTSQPNSADVALIEELTQKYLDFLNCAGASSSSLPLSGRTPQYRLNIYREPSSSAPSSAAAAAAATMFYLESASSDTEDAELMQNLIRQEDERGDRNREKKLRHRMRRLTLSSSGAQVSFRRIDFQVVDSPFITRSISSDSNVRPGRMPIKSFLTVPGLMEYQENTRSAPDLPGDEFQARTRPTSNYSTESEDSLQLDLEIGPPESNAEDSPEEEEDIQDNWIKPGETRSCENSQQDLGPSHHNLLDDLKGFSRRLQKMMHLSPKSSELEKKHPFVPSLERKPYYSSQPELPSCSNDWLGSNLSGSSSMLQLNFLPSYGKIMQRSASLNHLVAPDTPVPPNTLLLKAPELRVCPSTPTPTQSNLVVFDYNNSPCLTQLDQSVNISNSTNHSNHNNESSLLAPFAIRQQQPPRVIRSSSELQQQPCSTGPAASTGPSNIPTTVEGSSPNLKRFASPVSSSRLKLTPSPSKSGISATTNADSASTSTASTATTMVPATVGEICRRSSDSDLSVTPKGNSICVASERLVAATAMMRLTQPTVGAKPGTATDSLDMLEYPFLTMTKYPTGFILHLGATVAARSVKLLERVPNPDEPEVRDSWWTELRMEIRSHARSLGCNVVLGYAETTTISDDVCVLSATGTAAVINMVFNRSVSQTDIFTMSKATASVAAMTNSVEDGNGSTAGDTSIGKDSGSLGTGTVGGKPLPVPQVPKIVAGNSWTDKQKLNELQKKLQETFERNQEIYQLKSLDPDLAANVGGVPSTGASGDKQSDTDDSDEEEMNEIDLNCGNKELCVLEVDDIEDLEIISLLMEPYPPEGFHVVNTQQVPGMLEMDTVKNLQMFTQVWRARLEVGQSVNGFPKHFQRLLQTIYFKLRTMIPCAICDLRFRLDLPETDQIQLLVTGMAMGLSDANRMKYRGRGRPAQQQQQQAPQQQNGFHDGTVHATQSQPELNGKRMLQEEDYIFPLDEDQMVDTPTPTSTAIPPFGMSSFKMRKTSPSRLNNLVSGLPSTGVKPLNVGSVQRSRYFPLRDRYGVDVTPLSFIPGGRIDKYLGKLNFFFIRESTSIRENGGISGFVHGFITELLAVVRAHIASLGGNAMVSFYITELMLFDNQHKNQGQCLISIGGDAVYVSYHADD
ncbi:GD21093 [Drosophila simulans]|uniref:GD21093 n=1 Tax=Drosophila simulans TaxID=7240 RepID=B4QT50_DROSI|nr:GD21093 [Drosophila simulans]